MIMFNIDEECRNVPMPIVRLMKGLVHQGHDQDSPRWESSSLSLSSDFSSPYWLPSERKTPPPPKLWGRTSTCQGLYKYPTIFS